MAGLKDLPSADNAYANLEKKKKALDELMKPGAPKATAKAKLPSTPQYESETRSEWRRRMESEGRSTE